MNLFLHIIIVTVFSNHLFLYLLKLLKTAKLIIYILKIKTAITKIHQNMRNKNKSPVKSQGKEKAEVKKPTLSNSALKKKYKEDQKKSCLKVEAKVVSDQSPKKIGEDEKNLNEVNGDLREMCQE